MNNFAVLTIAYTHSPSSSWVTITTNTPCHLTCYYTDKPPLRHNTSRTDRGLTLPWGAYYCFVAWHSVEQIEPGDTLTHTFAITPWAYCQTKYFAYRGTVADVLSPSVSPIFQHHHPGANLYQHYNTGDQGEGSMFGDEWRAQTFTPIIPHKTNLLILKLFRTGLPGTLTAIIQPTLAGKPTGETLIAATTNANTLPTEPTYEWREIYLDLGYNLTAGLQYAIVLKSQAGTAANRTNWRTDCVSPTYLTGQALYSHNAGSTWTKVPTCDYMFEEYGTPQE